MSSSTETRAPWLPPALLALLTTLMFWPLLFGGRVLYWGTPLLQFYPWRQTAVEMLRVGALPLWLNAAGNGAPLLANHQTAALYPLNVLFLIWPVERALGYSAALHVLLAGLGMWLLARWLRLSQFAALLGAVAYMFSAFIISRLNFPSMTCASAWMPYIWLAGGRLATRRRPRDIIPLAGVIALQFLAGHAQLWYYSLWALGLFVLWLALSAPATPGVRNGRRRLTAILTVLVLTLAAVFLGVTLAAGQFLPTAELALNSQRQAGAAYDFAMTYSFWPWRLLTFFAPDFFGSPAAGDYWGYGNYWEDAGYVGVLPLLLLAPALLAWRAARRAGRLTPALRLVPFLVGLVIVSLLLALGKNLPLYPLAFRYVPGFGFFQGPARLLYWTTLALALLAAIGADSLPAWARRRKTAILLMVIGAGLFLAGLAAQIALAAVKATFGPALMRAAATLILSSIPLALSDVRGDGRLGRLAARAWPGLAVLILAADLLAWGRPFNPTTTPAAYAPFPNRAAALLAQDADVPYRIFTFDKAEYDLKFKRYLSFRDFGDSTPARQRELRETLLPNAHVIEGVESAGNFDPLLSGRYKLLMDAVNAADGSVALRLLGLMNVAYIVQPAPPTPDLLPLDAGDLPTRIYKNPAALPRAWWTPAARCLPNGAAALATLQQADFDPRQEVVLEKACAEKPADHDGNASFTSPPAALRYRPNGVTIAFNAPASGYLVLADNWYPGWRAVVDGQPAEILRANVAFRALAVSAGDHVAEFRYAPPTLTFGLLSGCLAWLGAAVAWAWPFRRRIR